MKVGNIKKQEFGMPGVRTMEHTDVKGDGEISFRRALTELSREQYEIQMGELIGKIDRQAEKLTKRADIKEFQKYRQLIKEFLEEVVSNGYAFSKENTLGTRGKNRFFATVKTIDQKLDELAKEVLSGQADSIDMLHRIDDIRGLILDIML